MANALKLAAPHQPGPNAENGKVAPPRRRPNRERRTREHLTSDEVGRLMAAAAHIGRHGHRDATLILLAYRHGLRVGELVALRWDQVDLKQGMLHVARLKNGVASTHPLRGPELRALRRLRREYSESPYLFSTERRGPLTDSGVRKIVARAGIAGDLGFPVHPHMLRHACGFKLANDGHDTGRSSTILDTEHPAHGALYGARAGPGADSEAAEHPNPYMACSAACERPHGQSHQDRLVAEWERPPARRAPSEPSPCGPA